MIAAKSIENRIAGMEPIKVFTVADLGFPPEWRENVRVKLGRMVRAGMVEKAGRGRYYRPKTSVFGNIEPDQSEIVKDLMYDNGILSGYITGYTVWNRMGLTSQISNVIIIGTSRRRDSLKRGNYHVRFITQPNKITAESVPLLQILDALKMIKQIPDSSVDKSMLILKKYVADLEEYKLSALVRLSKKYPPRVRALLGAILESIGYSDKADEIKLTLNPTTVYSIGLSESACVDLNNWNIE